MCVLREHKCCMLPSILSFKVKAQRQIFPLLFHSQNQRYIITQSCIEWVTELAFAPHSTNNRSLQRRVFPGNPLHWYWQPKTIKHNITYPKHKTETEKLTKQSTPWFGTPSPFKASSQETEWVILLQPCSPHGASCIEIWSVVFKL